MTDPRPLDFTAMQERLAGRGGPAEPIDEPERVLVPRRDALWAARRPGQIPKKFLDANLADFRREPEDVRADLNDWAVRPDGRNLLVLGPVGVGKAQPLDAQVLTPSGWVEMGALRVGDALCAPTGGLVTVRGVHPQGRQLVCRVATKDGGVTHATWDHLWRTSTRLDRDSAYRKVKGSPGRIHGEVRTLRQVSETMRHPAGTLNHWLPLPSALAGSGFVPPVDPYLLGLLLGDGAFRPSGIAFTTADSELVQAVERLLPVGVGIFETRQYAYYLAREANSGRNPLLDAVRSLGLGGHRSYEKFVPRSYLTADPLVRLAVLQGLLDTDGHASGHRIDYISTSKQLAEDVRALTVSLGGHCTIQAKQPVCVVDGVPRPGRPAWRCYPVLPSWVAPFRLARKSAAYSPRVKYPPHRAISDIEEVGVMETQCITVDGGLYVTDSGLVTHNSRAAVAACRRSHFHDDQTVDFWPVVELLDHLRPGGPPDALDRVMGVDVLILDDLGAERPTDWTFERLYALVNRRWLEELPTVATTNLPGSRRTAPTGHDGPTLDEVLGDRMFSRLVGGAVVVRLSGPDRRRTGP